MAPSRTRRPFRVALLTAATLAGMGSAAANPPPAGGEWAAFQAYKQQTQSEFEQYRRAYLDAFDAYRDEVLGQWDEAPLGDAHTLVQYSEDQHRRTEVDYQSGTVTISVLHDPGQAPDPKAIQDALVALAQSDTAEARAQDPIHAKLAAPPTQLPVLNAPQPLVPELAPVVVDSGQAAEARVEALIAQAEVTTRPRDYSAERLAKLQAELARQQQAALRELERQQELAALAEASEPEQAQPAPVPEAQAQALQSQEREREAKLAARYAERQADPTAKQITTYRIQLPSHGQQQRARPFLDQAHAQAQQWQVEPELVLAIMQAESSFNPLARSHIPAFGLMQIVPASAGRDVRQTFYQSRQAPTAEELYRPEFNIRFGSAYLNILDKRYLKGVTDPQSRLYCVIAAYNTGAGNVAKAFNSDGSRRLSSALPRINALSPEAVYQHLVEHLPYDETRKYLTKVRNYREGYAALATGQKL
ncbi:transglycosylase SLT domain-containing protein [Ferrimonas balearica]|uniref:transglycosylase SLT domain-containing protein n=1 Tax=Ferrimonas balearica TaxID=44012 RepID=UPI001C993EB2|nr:transglycosylase SLT domain-containing protein [Ferrimonas balearica]MBY5992887.1 transglycosylase SLT domain-containing protein [Ferrimonas balearica]